MLLLDEYQGQLPHILLAVQQSQLSTMNYTHGSVIVKGGQVIGWGYNSNRSRYDCKTACSLHAEVAALLGIKRLYCFLRGSQQKEI